MNQKTIGSPWWEELYDELLAEVLLERTSNDELRATAEFLIRESNCESRARFFDQCCGNGRISLELTERGYGGVGVDQAAVYIERANQAVEEQRIADLRFTVADAFEYRAAPGCDFAFNWWTSFGYAGDDSQNRKMLERAIESLRPGGFFALDFMNVPGVIENFQPEVHTVVESTLGQIDLLRRSELDMDTGVMRKQWIFSLDGSEPQTRCSEVKLYHPEDLARLFREAGFVEVAIYGDLDSNSISVDSARCIVTGRRAGDE